MADLEERKAGADVGDDAAHVSAQAQVQAEAAIGAVPAMALKDFVPLPDNTDFVSEPGKKETSAALADGPTDSHALATQDHADKGLAQAPHEEEVLDLGWNKKEEEVPQRLVGGLENEDLWLLIRRFNKQIYHVKATPYPVLGSLDLNGTGEEEFTPDKLRAVAERLYLTVVVGVLATLKHIARLRSWNEPRRTAGFAAVYVIAWLLDFVTPLLCATVIALVAYPPARRVLFPPAPLALVDSKHGGLQEPKAGVLASNGSLTGAPEHHKGEAAEQEAQQFISNLAGVVPDPSGAAPAVAAAKDKAAGAEPESKTDGTKVPMQKAVWDLMHPALRAVIDLVDTWERIANALSPTPPFPRETHRLRLAGLVIPVFGISLFVTSYMFVKGLTFGLGLGFFGDPILRRGMDWLNQHVPNWQKLLSIRNTMLKGVPTNAQLALTLLRVGEANSAPIPPPPHKHTPPPNRAIDLTDHLDTTGADAPLNATAAELEAAMQPQTEAPTSDRTEEEHAKHGNIKDSRFGRKVLSFFKSSTKPMVKAAIGTDAARAKVGSQQAKDRLGAVLHRHETRTNGPVEFSGRFEGRKGHVYIATQATVPVVGFGQDHKTTDELRPEWSVAVGDIVELDKVGGYGWKAKIVVGWSLGREVADGIEIKTADGKCYRVTAVPERNELFNRLVAIGGQKWISL